MKAAAPTRVLYLATSGQVGGAERCLLSLLDGLDAARFTPHVLMGSPGPLEAMLTRAGVAHSLLALPPALRSLSRIHRSRGVGARCAPLWQAPLYRRRLQRAVEAAQPALIHSNGFKMHLLAASLPRRERAPLLWHLHDFPVAAQGASANRLLRGLAGRVSAAVANSRAVADAYNRLIPALAPKMRVIPNGVSSTTHPHGWGAAMQGGNGAGFRARWGLAPEDFVIGMVAIFAPWKGQEIFLQAARQVLAVDPAVRFLLTGDDIYDTTGHGGRRRALEAQVRELGIAEAVRFTGFVADNIASAYAALDVMVHASTAPEPFGRTAIEAMAAGVPVIAAAAGGMLEVVEDGRSGLLTPPGDAGALAAAMLQLRQHPELRRKLAAEGRLRVASEFSEATVAAQFGELYQELGA